MSEGRSSQSMAPGSGRGGGEGRGEDREGRAQGARGRKVASRLGLKSDELTFDYKDPQLLGYFITDRGKIMPRRMTGLTAKQQRQLARAIKQARQIALLPYTRTD